MAIHVVKLTDDERKILARSAEFVLAGEWPWDDMEPEILESASEKLGRS